MRYLIGFVLALSFALPVAAQDFQKDLDAYSRGDYATALHEWRPLAEQGVTVAQFELGLMYENGQGVQQDYVMAYMWYDLAALGGFKQILPGQGRMGMKMTSVDISEAKRLAREWLRMHGKTP